MKKVLSLSIVLLICIFSFTQPQKDELVQKIKDDYSFIQGVAFDNMSHFTLSESLWSAILDENKNPQGKKYFAALGTDFIECHDYLFDTKMICKCDGYSYPSEATKSDCEKEIIADKNKIQLIVNAPSIKFTTLSYRLLMGYISTVGDFISAGTSTYGFNRNWRPKNKELQITIVLTDKAKDIVVKWSADGKTATITGPAYNEVDGWDKKIGKGLESGGVKKD